jgi:hypothetical protein
LSDAGTIKFRHPSGRHDDLLWALALACYVAKEGMEKGTPILMAFSSDELSNPQDETMDRVLGRFRGSGITITDVKVIKPGDG